jgi:hypothetical protein
MTEFSPRSYDQVLAAIREHGFGFHGFADVVDGRLPDDKICLLRHDVDVSMDFALDMARQEARHGVRST